MYQLLDPRTCSSEVKIGAGSKTAIVDIEDLALAAISPCGGIVYANRLFLDKFKLEKTDIHHLNIRDIVSHQWDGSKRDPDFSAKGGFHRLIHLRTSKSGSPVGYLFVGARSSQVDERAVSLKEIARNPDHPLFATTYCGLYVADPEAYTLKVNPSYEKIAFLPENELVGRNLRELEEKGYFSQSVTLRVLAELKKKNTGSVTLFQKIITGKEVIVTGTPIFSRDGKLTYIVTFVRDLVTMDTIAQKCEAMARSREKSWRGEDLNKRPILPHSPRPLTPTLPLLELLPFIAQDPTSLAVLRQAVNASLYHSPVFLTGETGVGKDLIAKYIHLLSSQTEEKPFVTVNCSAIPKDLLESELFGYEEGAFSGARRGGKKGLFEQAHGGILFLNEISEMPLSLQAKLLTALDEGFIRRLGSTKAKRVRARIICATNSDLRKKVEDRSFRSDLYYRIKVLAIHVPPLRERREDILPLVRYFTGKICRDYGMRKFLSPAVQETLQAYRWPGNVRELRNLIERLVVFSTTRQISVGDLPEEVLDNDPGSSTPHRFDLPPGVTLKDAVRQYEQGLIRTAVEKHGTLAAAARVLRVDPTTLSRKLKR